MDFFTPKVIETELFNAIDIEKENKGGGGDSDDQWEDEMGDPTAAPDVGQLK